MLSLLFRFLLLRCGLESNTKLFLWLDFESGLLSSWTINGFSSFFLFFSDVNTESESENMINVSCLSLKMILRARSIAHTSAVKMELSIGREFLWIILFRTAAHVILLWSFKPSVKTYDLPRWWLDKANWKELWYLWQKHLIENNTKTAHEFSEKLINIAKTCIPQNPTTHKRDRPWLSKECKQAIRLRRLALRKFNTEPTTSNLISFKFHPANACKIIKEYKKKSRQNYMSKLNASSNIKTVWLMIRKIAGKKQPTPLKHFSVSNQKITEKRPLQIF